MESFLKERNIKWIQCLSIDKITRNNMKYMYIVGNLIGGKKSLLYKTWCPKDSEINDIMKQWLAATFD